MLETHVKAINKDSQVLVKDAQALFESATKLTGEKADEVRRRAMDLLDAAVSKAQEAQESMLVAGKEMVSKTDNYVKERPWQAVSAAAGAGLVVGAMLYRYLRAN